MILRKQENTCLLVCTASKNFQPASYPHAIVWMLNNKESLQPPYSLIQEPATNCWETQLLCSHQHCCIVVLSSVLLNSTHLMSNQLKLYYVKLYGTFLVLILDAFVIRGPAANFNFVNKSDILIYVLFKP